MDSLLEAACRRRRGALPEVTTGRNSSHEGQFGSPGRGKLRTFVTFAVTIALSYPDKPRQRQLAYVLGGSGVPSKWLAIA